MMQLKSQPQLLVSRFHLMCNKIHIFRLPLLQSCAQPDIIYAKSLLVTLCLFFLGFCTHQQGLNMAGVDYSMEKHAGNIATFLFATSNQELYGSINVQPHYSLYRLHCSLSSQTLSSPSRKVRRVKQILLVFIVHSQFNLQPYNCNSVNLTY